MEERTIGAAAVVLALAVGGCASSGGNRGQIAQGPTSSPPNDGYELSEVGEDWENGEPMYRQQVKVYPDGTEVRHGTRSTYWENGQRKLEMHFVDGVPHGSKKSWHLDGSNWSEGGFVDGREDGNWVTWYGSGQKQQEFHMKDGALHGMQTAWFADGQKRSEGRWINGKQTGFFTIWDAEGNIVQEIDYGQPEQK